MSPEREISEKVDEIERWIFDTKKGVHLPSYFGHPEIYIIDNEPVVIYRGPEKKTLFCSDKHAKELEQAEIVSFSEAKETTS